MNLFEETIDWETKLQPILQKYKGRKHPLEYQNTYQLLVMVVLSAQDSDANINKIAPELFEAFPNMESLSVSSIDAIIPHIATVHNFGNKAKWLLDTAQTIKKDAAIPMNLNDLVKLKGIGRKSANVILHESHKPAEGIIADLHVIRVAPRIGIIPETKDGIKAEKLLMEALPKSIWNSIGMAISFLGRETCRPKPKCEECLLKKDCLYYQTHQQ